MPQRAADPDSRTSRISDGSAQTRRFRERAKIRTDDFISFPSTRYLAGARSFQMRSERGNTIRTYFPGCLYSGIKILAVLRILNRSALTSRQLFLLFYFDVASPDGETEKENIRQVDPDRRETERYPPAYGPSVD